MGKGWAMLTLTPANYHSPEANRAYWSNSSYGGMYGWMTCAARARAIQQGLYTPPPSAALLAGTMVDLALLTPDEYDAWHDAQTAAGLIVTAAKGVNEGRNAFKVGPKADYVAYAQAERMIERVRRTPAALVMLEGDRQTMLTGTIGGRPWRAKLDVFNRENGRIVDLKTTKDFERHWVERGGKNQRLAWYEEHNYPRQLAIYQELAWQNYEEMDCLCSLVAVTKTDPSACHGWTFQGADWAERFAAEIRQIEEDLPRLERMRSGEEDVTWCGQCPWCWGHEPFRLAFAVA